MYCSASKNNGTRLQAIKPISDGSIIGNASAPNATLNLKARETRYICKASECLGKTFFYQEKGCVDCKYQSQLNITASSCIANETT